MTEYKTDERQVTQSLEPFRRYLRMLTVDAKPATIHILAHSMGNQLLTKALDGYDLKNGLGPGEELPRIRLPDIESVVYVAEDTIPEELGHGYYAHHPNVVVDLSQLINEYRSASERTMPHAETLLNAGNARVWQLR